MKITIEGYSFETSANYTISKINSLKFTKDEVSIVLNKEEGADSFEMLTQSRNLDGFVKVKFTEVTTEDLNNIIRKVDACYFRDENKLIEMFDFRNDKRILN